MRLLVVEDDRSLAGALEQSLTAEGFVVDVSHDGDDGLWRASEENYDAIVLDLMLPGRNGYQVCADLRAQGVWTPIVILTAKDGDFDEAEALDTGADDFIRKPFSPVVLAARIRALLRRAVRERPAVLTCGDLSLDPAGHRCERDGQLIGLTATEFVVLEYLMRTAGDVSSKLEILEHVWDFAYDGDPNLVEVYISSLRRKIDLPFGRSAITTIRGRGYRLEPDGG
jgi:two-component system OmpR family response regulator